MTEAKTKDEMPVWTWEMFEPGLESPPIVMPVTRESIANYAKSVLNNNPIYYDDEAAKAEGYDSVVAAPTMVFAYAPMQRWELFNSLGYLLPEQTSEPRSTPFVGAEVTFQDVPVYPGDEVTSTTSVHHTWESRSGNKFVSFRVVGHNQRGEKVCDYLYNIIWEYSRGRKVRQS